MVIPRGSFVLHFHSDGSNTDWGYKMVAVPTTKAPTCSNPVEELARQGRTKHLTVN